MYKENLLFICSRNRWRSLTAEHLLKNNLRYHATSAGTSKTARIKVNSKMIEQANMIFVMEKKHKIFLHEKFKSLLQNKPLIVLNIPDQYEYGDEVLKKILHEKFILYLKL